MAGWADVARIALELPDTSKGTSHGDRSWQVRDKSFVWERPLRTSDLRHLGEPAPPGPILGVRTADLGAKEGLLASNPDALFTTPHFDGYAAVLVQLDNDRPGRARGGHRRGLDRAGAEWGRPRTASRQADIRTTREG